MPIALDFAHADQTVAHFNGLVTRATDPLIAAKYAGFVSVAAVCAYEMSVKDIFITFSVKKHVVLGNITRDRFDRISGRIGYKVLKDEYVPMFGEKYSDRFAARIRANSRQFLKANGRDFISSYNNVVLWRNDFVHAARLPTTATFNEVMRSYEDGKEVIRCLNLAMDR